MLEVDPQIYTRFPGVLIGTVHARELDNRCPQAEITTQLRAAEALARDQLAGVPIVEHPHIAPWRDAYRAFGAKPKKYPSSIEALGRRVVKGGELPSINPLVDLYNAVSLRHLLPVGGEDLERINGRLQLRFAGDDEPETSLLGRPVAAAPEPGEVIYADAESAVCRRWNWREAARTCLSAETSSALLVIELLPPVAPEILHTALNELAAAVTRYCGASTEVAVLRAP